MALEFQEWVVVALRKRQGAALGVALEGSGVGPMTDC